MRFKINLLHFLLATVFLGTAISLYISNMPRELVDLTADNFKKLVVDMIARHLSLLRQIGDLPVKP